MHADLQRLLNPNLLTELTDKPMDRLRAIRVELSQAEGDVSMVRRVTQGRMDIVGHEVEHRTGASQSADNGPDPTSLLFDMPDIMAEGSGPPPSGGPGRKVSFMEPGQVAAALIETLDAIASPSQLSGLSGVDAASLSDLMDGLREFELELSAVRRDLHDRIDNIQDEIARRYRDGEATVDALLQQIPAAEDPHSS